MRPKYDARQDPVAQAAHADLKALLERFIALSRRSDQESPAVGKLWGVTRGLGIALDAADRELGDRARPMAEDRPAAHGQEGTQEGVQEDGGEV